jgi:2'-5' RNA ligase
MFVYAPGDSALLAMASPRVCAAIRPWRRLYDPYWRTVPSHVTLAYPPFVRAEGWAAARAAVAACVAAFPPFWIMLAELAAFEQPRAVLWLRPDDGGMCQRIHAALGERFPAWVSDGPLPFTPHVTLGFFDSLADLAQAHVTIAAAWRPLRFRVHALSYAALDASGVWRTVDTLPLAAGR